MPETFAAQFEGAAEFTDLECDIGGPSRERMLRLKIGNDQMVPWGECGAGLRAFFSMWINGRKVVSKKYFHMLCRWGQFDDVDAVVFDGRKLLLCTYPNTGENWSETEKSAPEQLACIDASEIHTNAAVDEIEYPADGSERREGHVELLTSSNDPLCSLVEEAANLPAQIREFSDEFTRAETPTSYNGTIEERYRFSPKIVDINNDGFVDMIALQIRGQRGYDFFISMLIDGALTPVTINSDIPAPSSAVPLFLGGSADYLGNLFSVSIFKWKEDTYVSMNGWLRGRSPDRFVMQMQPDGTADTICELDRIEINF